MKMKTIYPIFQHFCQGINRNKKFFTFGLSEELNQLKRLILCKIVQIDTKNYQLKEMATIAQHDTRKILRKRYTESFECPDYVFVLNAKI